MLWSAACYSIAGNAQPISGTRIQAERRVAHRGVVEHVQKYQRLALRRSASCPMLILGDGLWSVQV